MRCATNAARDERAVGDAERARSRGMGADRQPVEQKPFTRWSRRVLSVGPVDWRLEAGGSAEFSIAERNAICEGTT